MRHATRRARLLRAALCLLAVLTFGVRAGDGAVERGRYVAHAANCAGCHTREGGAPFAGGRAFATPLGTIYSSNITPHPARGIGDWSERDLERALRAGIRADGAHLFPVFPYPAYTRMSDADIADLAAYLRTLSPVDYLPPENGWLFAWRWPMWIWNALFLVPGPYREDPAQGAEWNRGAYLVQGPGHCGSCHTPRNLLFAERSGRALQGALMAVGHGERRWFAVDLTSSRQGLAAWKTADLVAYFRKGFSVRGASSGPMNEVIGGSLRYLDEADLRAMAVYLKSLPGRDYAGEPVPPALAEAGAAIYAKRCKKCHGASGRGGFFSGPPLAGSAIAQGEYPASLLNQILYGSDTPQELASPVWETMPALHGALDDAEVAAVANFVRGSWGNRARAVTAHEVREQR